MLDNLNNHFRKCFDDVLGVRAANTLLRRGDQLQRLRRQRGRPAGAARAAVRAGAAYADPFDFIAREPLAETLAVRQRDDLARAEAVAPATVLPGGSVYLLLDCAWARRVQGSFANALSVRSPAAAHAVLRAIGPGVLLASVRAPRRDPRGADSLCRRFATGGGRPAAAGIDRLPTEPLPKFISAFDETYPGTRPRSRTHGG